MRILLLTDANLCSVSDSPTGLRKITGREPDRESTGLRKITGREPHRESTGLRKITGREPNMESKLPLIRFPSVYPTIII